jgi:hypothetical protein
MSANQSIQSSNPSETDHARQIIRFIAAGLAAIIAAIYLMIGFNIITVLDTPADQVFGFPAALAYALGIALMIRFDRRIIWILGAVLQVFVVYMYFSLAGQRSPAYEIWGILLRVVQGVLLITLAFLSVRWPLPQIRRITQRQA